MLSLGYNSGMAILGELTPMVAVYTIKRSQYDLSPAFADGCGCGFLCRDHRSERDLHRACVRPSEHPNFHDIELRQMNERELIARQDHCATLHMEVADLGRSPSSVLSN